MMMLATILIKIYYLVMICYTLPLVGFTLHIFYDLAWYQIFMSKKCAYVFIG